jgi:2-polyprenyl-6-methoxyphenol hydroxylase-like FAD-dependent oxidoreductase
MTPEDRLLLPPRADLYEALIDRTIALGVEIRTSSLGVSVRPEGVLILESGEERKADLVIAADGAYSRLRESILATSWIDYGAEAGTRMMIDNHPDDETEIITEYWNGRWRLLYNPCTDGENYIFLSGPLSESAAQQSAQHKEFWRAKFPAAADLAERFHEAGHWDRIINVRCRHWSQGRVALIGDAAHAMPPNLGQSANMAFSNAMALALTVTETADVPSALRIWEAQQRGLSDHVQWWSYIYGLVIGKWPGPLMSLRSDLLRSLAKTEWFDEGLNRGARHEPAGFRKRG